MFSSTISVTEVVSALTIGSFCASVIATAVFKQFTNYYKSAVLVNTALIPLTFIIASAVAAKVLRYD